MNEIDLEKCLTSGQVFRWRPETGSTSTAKAWVGVDGCLAFRLDSNDIFLGQSDQAVEVIQRLFRLDWDYEMIFAEMIRNGPELEPLIAQARGLRMMRPSCPRETLFTFLCTSNNHISRITQMVGKLAAYGDPLQALDSHSANNEMRRWPDLDRIADIPESELRLQGFGYRAATIPKVAQAILVRGGEQWFIDLRARPYAEAFTELLTLPGVGPKLADCIALYAFDKTEATPTDTHLWQAVTRTYFQDWREAALTEAKRRHVGEFLRDRFGLYAGLAQQILFYDNLLRGRRTPRQKSHQRRNIGGTGGGFQEA